MRPSRNLRGQWTRVDPTPNRASVGGDHIGADFVHGVLRTLPRREFAPNLRQRPTGCRLAPFVEVGWFDGRLSPGAQLGDSSSCFDQLRLRGGSRYDPHPKGLGGARCDHCAGRDNSACGWGESKSADQWRKWGWAFRSVHRQGRGPSGFLPEPISGPAKTR
jgi:hypothetical protein